MGEGDENKDQDKAFTAWTKTFWKRMRMHEDSLQKTAKEVAGDEQSFEDEFSAEPMVTFFGSIFESHLQ